MTSNVCVNLLQHNRGVLMNPGAQVTPLVRFVVDVEHFLLIGCLLRCHLGNGLINSQLIISEPQFSKHNMLTRPHTLEKSTSL